MIREIHENELKGLLELYLHLHESDVPEMSEHLSKTWKTIVEDKNHHIIIKVVDDKKCQTVCFYRKCRYS